MAAVEAGLLAVDAGQDKALVDELWNLVNPGVSEFSTGMTLEQQWNCIWHVTNKYGKTLKICPVKPSEDANPATAAAGPASEVFPDGSGVHIDYMTFAVNLVPLLGIDSNHFILRRKDDTDAPEDLTVEVLDSCLNVDGGTDRYPISQILDGAARIFGAGNPFGWAFAWTS